MFLMPLFLANAIFDIFFRILILIYVVVKRISFLYDEYLA